MRRCAWLLVLFLLPSAAQAKLELVSVQAVYGPLWPERRALDYYPPEDCICFRFYVAGVVVKDKNEIDVEIAATLADARGKVMQSQTVPMRGKVTLLGTGPRLVCAGLPITGALPAGEYTFRATFTDNLAGESVSFDRKVRMCPGEFGVRSVQLYSDPDRKVPAPPKTSGQPLYSRINIVGIQVKDGKVDVASKVELIDAQTQAVLGVLDLPLQDPSLARGGTSNVDSLLPAINGTGRVLLRLTATDHIANKTLHYEVPLEIHAP